MNLRRLGNILGPVHGRHEGVADYQQQEPGAELPNRYSGPSRQLLGVKPSLGESAYILRDPDEEGVEEARQQQRHPAVDAPVAKIDARSAKQQQSGCKEEIAHIENVVMRIEVQIDRSGEA